MTINEVGDFIKPYFDKSKRPYPAIFPKTTEMAENMRIHADGKFPTKLIGERRPSESSLLFNYRQKIYEPQTIQPFSKIQNSLAKIRKSQDWSIQHVKDVNPKIKDGESLEDYTEKNFPLYTSITNWMFTICLKQYLVDPNAVLVVSPKEYVTDNSYLQPFPVIYNSENVMYYSKELALFLSPIRAKFEDNKHWCEGDIFILFNKEEIWLATQINSKGDFKLELIVKHDLGFLPCRKLRAVVHEQVEHDIIYRSRLYPCLPNWNEVVREYSDMQASVCKHMFPTMVIHTNQKCTTCSGSGKTLQNEGKEWLACPTCKGTSHIPSSPYEDITVRPQMANELPLPTPMAYYIDKDTGIIEIQDKRIDNHLYRGYSAVNFEFLAVNLNQSGVAKELDRSELNAFIYDIAEDLVSILDDVYYFISEWRYKVLIPDQKARKEQLPKISVPEKYDIISESYLADQIAIAKTSKMNPFIVNALEIEYANKKFNTDTAIRDLVKLSLELDPLPGLTEDEKLVKMMNGAVLKTDYIISSYIVPFIRRAVDENEDFFMKTYKEKQDLLKTYAEEIEKESSANKELLTSEEPPQNNIASA